MGGYWYAVSDEHKECVFCTGPSGCPSEDHVRAFLRDNGVLWADSFRIVPSSAIESNAVGYVEVEVRRPLRPVSFYR